jgi:hypothetical protein
MQTNPLIPGPENSRRMLQVIANHWFSCCIYVAAKLNIADHLVNGPQTVSSLAAATGCHTASLYRVLRALASEGVFEETAPEVFALTPDATALLSEVPGTIKYFVLAELGDFYSPWGQLMHSVQTGNIAFDHHYGTGLWQYYTTHPEEGVNFMQAMTRLTQYTDTAIVAAYDFSGFDTIVDVGGGNGALLMSIIRSFPRVKGTVFDAPYVVERTMAAIADQEMSGRCDAQGGDFFREVPPGADAYMMKYILHDWHEADAILLLRNCCKAMKKGSKLLAIDAVIPPGNTAHPGKLMDINMLVVTGGRERTAAEFQYLFEQAGIQFNRVIDLSLPDVSIIEGEKI